MSSKIFQTQFIYIPILSSILLGCSVVTKITTNRDVSYKKSTKKLYIIDSITEDFHPNFRTSFQQKTIEITNDCKVNTYIHTFSRLELDENALASKVKNFNPDLLMTMQRIGGTKDQYGTITNALYDIKLFDNETNKIIWRASVSFYPRQQGTNGGIALAIDITNKLKEDQILLGCPIIPRD